MTDWGSVPDWLNVGLALAGGSAIARRRRQRVADFRQLVEDASGMAADEVLRRMEANPEVEEVIARAIEAAAITAHDEKRELLAKVVAAGLHDDAVVDETLLMVRTIDNIEPAHLRALMRLGAGAGRGGVHVSRTTPDVVLAHLRREGLAEEAEAVSPAAAAAMGRFWRATSYGYRLLRHLTPKDEE